MDDVGVRFLSRISNWERKREGNWPLRSVLSVLPSKFLLIRVEGNYDVTESPVGNSWGKKFCSLLTQPRNGSKILCVLQRLLGNKGLGENYRHLEFQHCNTNIPHTTEVHEKSYIHVCCFDVRGISDYHLSVHGILVWRIVIAYNLFNLYEWTINNFWRNFIIKNDIPRQAHSIPVASRVLFEVPPLHSSGIS